MFLEAPLLLIRIKTSFFCKKTLISNGVNILDIVLQSKLANSKGEVRRAIKNNGVKINDKLVGDENKILELSDFKKENMKVSFGKKKHFLFKIT